MTSARLEKVATARLQSVQMSARKARLVADLVRGRRVEEALAILGAMPNKAALYLQKVIRSSVSNADSRGGVDVDTLVVASISVDEGPTGKRHLARAHGRATPIHKRSCHMTVELGSRPQGDR